MLRRSLPSKATAPSKNYENWPWPKKLPLKPHWYHHLPTGPEQSISLQVRSIQTVGDCAVVATLCWISWRLYTNIVSGAYKTRLRHTTNMPPALVAQEIDFQDLSKNRFVPRAKLDEYRNEFAGKRHDQKIEGFIFKY